MQNQKRGVYLSKIKKHIKMNRTDLAVRNKNLFAEYQILWKIEKEKAESVKTKPSRNAVNQQLAVRYNITIQQVYNILNANRRK